MCLDDRCDGGGDGADLGSQLVGVDAAASEPDAACGDLGVLGDVDGIGAGQAGQCRPIDDHPHSHAQVGGVEPGGGVQCPLHVCGVVGHMQDHFTRALIHCWSFLLVLAGSGGAAGQGR